MSTSFGVDFGQKVDLTASIRNILRNYPEGTAVLKELVQNADDAGASTVIFYLDYRNHSTEKLADHALAPFQGPSLLVYNDAVFTAEDFNSIQRIGDSLKKSSEDSRAKIGRFGIGFNAVYHWTDLPSFISSNCLVMLDPQARFLPNVNPSNPGKMVDWIATPNIITQMPDQFKPYEVEGLNWAKPFKGTLFRLPLRTAAQAKTSLLSKRALSVEDAAKLLKALQVEASAMLLFLKSVIKIEIREWRESAPGVKSQSTVLFNCQVTNSAADMMKKRCLVSEKQQLQAVATNSELAIPADYTLNVQCTTRNLSAPYIEHWEICNQLGGRGASHIASDPDNALLRLIPWAGVAACVSVTYPNASAADGSLVGAHSPDTVSAVRDGLAYCFLPLPVRTGLPVMVNGFFELSSNRRDVWQSGADMTGDGRTRALWNISLMKDLIAPSYARLLLRLRDILGFIRQYQQLWPNIRAAGTPWDEVVRATLALSRDNKLLKVVTAADMADMSSSAHNQKGGGGAAGSPAVSSAGKTNSVFSGFGKKSAEKSDTSQWISCAAAVLLPLGYTLTADSTIAAHNTADAEELTAYLVRAQAPLVLCMEALKITLIETATCTSTATTAYVRSVLRGGSTTNTKPTPAMCKFLLKYCLSDLSFSSGANMIPATATALDGLPLLPLSDNTVTVLRIFSTTQVAAIAEVNSMGFSLSQTVSALSSTNFSTADACDLLASADNQQTAAAKAQVALNSILLLLDEPQLKVFHAAAPVLLNKEFIAPNEVDILSHSSIQKHSNVRSFQAQFIPDLLSFILPAECLRGKRVLQEELQPEIFEKTVQFLKVFWNYAATRGDVMSAIKEGAALVPSVGVKALFPLSRMSNLIVQRKGDVVLEAGMVEILQLLGVQIVDPLALHEVNSSYFCLLPLL